MTFAGGGAQAAAGDSNYATPHGRNASARDCAAGLYFFSIFFLLFLFHDVSIFFSRLLHHVSISAVVGPLPLCSGLLFYLFLHMFFGYVCVSLGYVCAILVYVCVILGYVCVILGYVCVVFGVCMFLGMYVSVLYVPFLMTHTYSCHIHT